MATKQYWIEEGEKDLRQQVLQELVHHQELQRAWALGPLQLYRRRGMLEILAYYWDIESNRRPQTFLGSGKGQKAWYQALQRVNHVESFL